MLLAVDEGQIFGEGRLSHQMGQNKPSINPPKNPQGGFLLQDVN